MKFFFTCILKPAVKTAVLLALILIVTVAASYFTVEKKYLVSAWTRW